ncbi:MAG: STAS domain-containing protein [Desulfohalobiaceae bacterium]|nr:STAS domain-containing protein [Desulfohalobiaceae bacterium]
MERIPILKWGNFLLVIIQVDLHDRLALALRDDLAEQIQKTGARGVLIDISALQMIDSFMGRTLGDMAATAGLLDAETVLVGMQPEVAITIVELGLAIKGIRTALDVDKGMALLAKRLGSSSREKGRVPDRTEA